MTSRVILFDVIETLFSLAPLKDRFLRNGAPEESADLFFAQLLRDAFALSAAGVFKPFPEIAQGTLRVLLESKGHQDVDSAVKDILSVFGELPAHPDVKAALESVHQAGARAVLLTNGSRANTEKLVAGAGLTELVDDVISIEDYQIWKPRSDVYREACQTFGVSPAEATLIAAHAWDVHGAMQAGLDGVWVRRQDTIFHPLMGKPTSMADSLPEAVKAAL
ncbi:haloacid dehalogenase type II [Marinobacter zhanjiangensis]|uniref:(S)-2-haloacid dehalogenase n=1 Tax=Marinobacter zhanjiangensis TaxID=578215 RepID=A0ABQ3AKR0_9GAMM|nr:haloacid dehalogenase type II [Marinobacter zhanjiangensis]GGY60363.1 haloacid dehalogenase [Marinobacter zhanjiangensis]